jgi:hypothetical protein
MRLIACYMALVLMLVCVSCDGGLSRSAAADMISKQYQAMPVITLYENDSSHGCNYGIVTPDCLNRISKEAGALYRLGYTDVVDNKIVLTEKGRKASAEWNAETDESGRLHIWHIPVAQPELVEVTGITEKENNATATFTWRQKPLNDIGEALGYGQVQQGAMRFQKYDDGWRPSIYSAPF